MVLTATAGAVLAILLGGLICFFGYRLLRVTLGILGFGVGAALGAVIATNIGGVTQVFVLIIAAACGLLGAVLAAVLYKVGVFMLGAGAGALIASLFAGGLAGATHTLVIIASAVGGGVLVLILQRAMVSALTAFAGAWGAVIGAFHLAGWVDMQLGLRACDALRQAPNRFILVLGCWIVLGIVGTAVQLSGRRRRRR
jgi:hypothetical protein